MSFRGRGGGGFRGRGGGDRGRGRGGGRGGRPPQDFGPPEHVVEVGYYTHPCEEQLVCKCTHEKIPYFNAPLYLENKERIGKIDEIFGTIRDHHFSVQLTDDVKAASFKVNQKLYIDPYKLLPLDRFLPGATGGRGRGGGRGGGGRGGRGGGDRGRGRGRGGFDRGRGGFDRGRGGGFDRGGGRGGAGRGGFDRGGRGGTPRGGRGFGGGGGNRGGGGGPPVNKKMKFD